MSFVYKIINEVLRLFTIFYLVLLVASIPDTAGKVFTESVRHHNKQVVCYVATWSVYRPGRGSFQIENVDGNLCTIVVYAFVGLDQTTNTLKSLDPYNDLEENYGKGSFKKMTELKKKYSHLKVTLGVGGWNEGSPNYSTMALKSDTRRKFIDSVLEYVTKYNFDGFDLDWEYPGSRGGRKEDKENYALLLKELKDEFRKKDLILSAALGIARDVIDAGYDIPEISKHLDYMYFMFYDYHGAWDKKVGHNAPLNSTDDLNVESSLKYILELGAPPEKIIMGIPAYGHTFITDNETESGVGTPVTKPGEAGVFTKQEGFQGYNEICAEFSKTENWKKKWDEVSSTPYAVKGKYVISYDDPRSVKDKVKLGLKYKIGGFMLWSIDTDDFHGDCKEKSIKSEQKFPLLRTINEGIEGYSVDEKTPSESHSSAEHFKSLPLAFTVVALVISFIM